MLDFHTHNLNSDDESLINASLSNFSPKSSRMYSAGIHPWHTACISANDLKRLSDCVALPQVKLIGETGIDAIKGASRERQTEIFIYHINLSEELRKPLLIHSVRTDNDIIALRKRLHPAMPWVIHGFRGNENIARQLLNAGIYISFGEYFNIKAVAETPLDKIFVESDDAKTPLADIYSRVAMAHGILPEMLVTQVARNFKALLAVK